MATSTITISYSDWRTAVDKHLEEIYCISIEDAGFNENYLIKRWQLDEPALEFVEWFGNKYDLDCKATLLLARAK